MNFGFDLDKIFIDTPPLIPQFIIDRLYKKRDNGVLLYRIPGWSEQIVRKFSHMEIFRPAIKANLEFIRNFPKDKNELYLISSRFKFLEARTNKIIQKYQLDKIFNDLYFNFSNEQPHIFKNRIIKRLLLDYYIDDDLSLLSYVAKYNPKTKFFWLNNVKEKLPTTKNITKISKLSQIIS